MSLSSQKYGFGIWDPGSEIRDPEKTHSGSHIPDPGVKKAPDPGSGSATLIAGTEKYGVTGAYTRFKKSFVKEALGPQGKIKRRPRSPPCKQKIAHRAQGQVY